MKTEQYIVQIKYENSSEWEDVVSFSSCELANYFIDAMLHPEGRWQTRIIKRISEE